MEKDYFVCIRTQIERRLRKQKTWAMSTPQDSLLVKKKQLKIRIYTVWIR